MIHIENFQPISLPYGSYRKVPLYILYLTDRNLALILIVSSTRLLGNITDDAHSGTLVSSEDETQQEHWYFLTILRAVAVFSLIRHLHSYFY